MPAFLRLATRNWQLKLLAVALAVLLWVVVSAEQVSTTWIDLPLTVEETDPDFQLLPESVPGRVRVRFAGPGREFIDLAIRQPSFVLRVGAVTDTEQAFELTPSMVRLPDGLEVSAYDVDPAFARLRFRQLATREVPVSVAFDSGQASGWALVGPLTVVPARVRVRGPVERVPGITGLSTVAISIPQRDGTFQEDVPLDLAALPGVELSARVVRVAGRSERVVARVIGDVDISVGPGLNLDPVRVNVLLQGARSAVDAAARADFRVVLAIDSIPGQLPPEGLAVPLRVEGIGAPVRATVEPATVRLLAATPLADTLSAGAAAGPTGISAAEPPPPP